MAIKKIENLDLYAKEYNLTRILEKTLTVEKIPTCDIYKEVYHTEPLGVTLEVMYSPSLHASYISMYGSEENISQVEQIVHSALEKLAQKH